MRGLMMDKPLLISSLIDFAEEYHGTTEIVSRTVEGPIHTYTYAEAAKRARQLANALIALGVQPGDRIGTVAWNGYRHFEIYYATSGMGRSATRSIRACSRRRSPTSSTTRKIPTCSWT